MRSCENNRQLRMAVNDERRYRMIQLEVKARIQSELQALQDSNKATDANIASAQRELQRLEQQVEAHKAWAAQQEAEEEARWRELGATHGLTWHSRGLRASTRLLRTQTKTQQRST